MGEDASPEDPDYSAIDFIVDSVGTGERGERDAPITVRMVVDGRPVTMEVDTGAAKLWSDSIGAKSITHRDHSYMCC